MASGGETPNICCHNLVCGELYSIGVDVEPLDHITTLSRTTFICAIYTFYMKWIEHTRGVHQLGMFCTGKETTNKINIYINV